MIRTVWLRTRRASFIYMNRRMFGRKKKGLCSKRGLLPTQSNSVRSRLSPFFLRFSVLNVFFYTLCFSGKIADHLPNKTASQCVLFYYRTKKTVDYRAIVAQRGGAHKRRGGRRAATKGSSLLANLNQKRTKPSRDHTASGTASPRPEPEDAPTPLKTTAPTAEAPPATPLTERLPTSKKNRTHTVSETPSTASSAGLMDSKLGVSNQLNGSNSRLSLEDLANVASLDKQTSSSSDALAAAELLTALAGPVHNPEAEPSLVETSRKKQKRRKPLLEGVSSSRKKPANGEGGVDRENRKISLDQVANGDGPGKDKTQRKKATVSSYWSTAEKAGFLQGLGKFGKEWSAVSQFLGGAKTAVQVRNYFHTNMEALGLEAVAQAAVVANIPVGVDMVCTYSCYLVSFLFVKLIVLQPDTHQASSPSTQFLQPLPTSQQLLSIRTGTSVSPSIRDEHHEPAQHPLRPIDGRSPTKSVRLDLVQ